MGTREMAAYKPTKEEYERRRQEWIRFMSGLDGKDHGSFVERGKGPEGDCLTIKWERGENTFDASFGSKTLESDLDVSVTGSKEILGRWLDFLRGRKSNLSFAYRWDSNFYYSPRIDVNQIKSKSKEEALECIEHIHEYHTGQYLYAPCSKEKEIEMFEKMQRLTGEGREVYFERAKCKAEGFISAGALYSAGVLNQGAGGQCPKNIGPWARFVGMYELLLNLQTHSEGKRQERETLSKGTIVEVYGDKMAVKWHDMDFQTDLPRQGEVGDSIQMKRRKLLMGKNSPESFAREMLKVLFEGVSSEWVQEQKESISFAEGAENHLRPWEGKVKFKYVRRLLNLGGCEIPQRDKKVEWRDVKKSVHSCIRRFIKKFRKRTPGRSGDPIRFRF